MSMLYKGKKILNYKIDILVLRNVFIIEKAYFSCYKFILPSNMIDYKNMWMGILFIHMYKFGGIDGSSARKILQVLLQDFPEIESVQSEWQRAMKKINRIKSEDENIWL